MLGKVFKAYDVRGTYPDPLTEKMAWQIGYGVSRFLLEDAQKAGESSPMMKNVVVGRDMRLSSPSLCEALIEGINAHGGDVIDIGLCDTPMITFAVNHLDCAGGVMTTASHNPPNYNGFKISKRKGKPVGEPTGLAEVRKHAAIVDKSVYGTKKGRTGERDLWSAYTEHVRSFLDLGKKRLKIVVDASNGMAGTMMPKVFGKNGSAVDGLELVEMNYDNTKGEFVHEPNPLVAENVEALCERVVAEHADAGICFDGDADRCVVVDELGRIVGCDHLTAVLAAHFLKDNPGAAVAFDLRSTKAVTEDIIAHGGKPVRERVGHVFMKQAMADNDCVFGGELSGHFYFRDNFNADSGAIAVCVVLSVLSRSGKKMSELVAPVSRYVQSGEINYEIEEKDEALAVLKEEFADVEGVEIDELDGVTIDCFATQGWWCNVRKSNTEPLLRLNLEARDGATKERMVARIAELLTPAETV